MAKQTIFIKLYIQEILYDILQKAYSIGDILSTDENAEQAAKIQELDEGNRNILLRSIGGTIANLRSHLSEYLVDDGNNADDILFTELRQKMAEGLAFGYAGKPATSDGTEDNNIMFLLRVPMNFNPAAKEDIAQAAHSYIVNTALTEWLAISSPANVEYYSGRANADLVRLLTAINKRIRPARIHTPTTDTPKSNDIRYE